VRTQKPKDFKQYSSKWGSKMYSSRGNPTQTMKKAGCGPTAAADVVYDLADKSVTPYTLALLFVEKGFRLDGQGTKPVCFKWTAKKYGLKFKKLAGLEEVVSCLDKGGLVVAHMGKGYWTNGGHYICLWAYKDGYLYACDPGSSKRKKQEAKALKKQCKGFYGFMAP